MSSASFAKYAQIPPAYPTSPGQKKFLGGLEMSSTLSKTFSKSRALERWCSGINPMCCWDKFSTFVKQPCFHSKNGNWIVGKSCDFGLSPDFASPEICDNVSKWLHSFFQRCALVSSFKRTYFHLNRTTQSIFILKCVMPPPTAGFGPRFFKSRNRNATKRDIEKK